MPASEQGVHSDRYRVIPRTLIFVFDNQQRVLLIKGSPEKRLWANRYNGIGGHIEQGEDMLSAARRELVEETGLTSNDIRLVGTVLIDTGQETGISLFVFKGSYSGGELTASHEGQLEWIAESQLQGLPLVEDLYSLLPLVWRHSVNEPPFSARTFYNEQDQLVIAFSDQD